MNTFLFASVENLWLVAGWTMIHFLWFGTIVALAALLCRWLLCRASANVRYATSLACFALLAGLPIAIATWLHQNPPPSQVKESLRRGEPKDGFVVAAAREPIANPTSEPIVDLAKQEPISTNATASTPAQIATHAEVIRPSAPTTSPAPSAERDTLSLVVVAINTAVHYLPWLWLIGTPITFALTATGLIGTRRLRCSSRPIIDGLIHETLEKLATSLRLTRHVAVAMCDRIAAPVLIGILRPIILLPPAALTGYSPDEIEMVLLHELAHVRRWDNLVNLIQRLVESLLFFHPAVWLISSWVRREREACCDALVVTCTDRPHAYAELLVALAAQMPRSVLFHPVASSAMAAGPLRSRIRRILKLDDDPMLVSGKSIAVLLASLMATATIVGLYLPTDGRAEPSKPESRQNDDHAGSPAAEFSHQVKFEKGAAKFLDGDSISIDEVRGTAETFLPGNRYWIKGTYKLKSHDRAQISAFTTAARAEDGTGPIQSEQTRQINGGEATFTLILPMSVRGWPHVSFYPADNGGDFGGIYFGTGDFVLKKWWGSEAAESANESNKPTWSDADRERFHRFEKAVKDVEIVVALFNDKDGFYPALDETHKQLAQHERSLYTYGLKADPSSVEAKRFNLTSAPTCIVFRSGKEVFRLTPVESAKQLQEFVTIAVNSGARDITQLLPLFQRKDGELAPEKIYKLPAALEAVFPELPELIERLKKDPSRSQFTYNLKDSGRVMEVFAPDVAHRQFFGPRIAQWEKNLKSDSNAEKQTRDNLKNLSLAIQNYHDTRKVLPAHAIYDAKGQPLLSWRVQILPFLDEWKLYQEFHLNEPWDSEHNRKLIARMPDVFKNPKVNKPGMTNYLAVVGKECVFNGSPKGLSIMHVTDGTSNTIAFVEANADLATEWTKPQDWNFDRAEPTKGLGQLWPGGWYAAWVDGSVRRIEKSEKADRIGIQFTRAGGESKSLAESANRTVPEGVGPEAAPGEAADASPAAAPGPASGEATEHSTVANSKSSSAPEPQVIAALPDNWQNDASGSQVFFKAVAEAEKKNLRVDVSQRDGKYVLVATPQPTEKDWPAFLGESPRKERVIGEKAWQRLGLKLIPATSAEQTAGMSGLRIIGGNLPKGLPLSSLLTKIDNNDYSPTDMDQLLVWLESESGQSQKPVRCYATADGKEFLFYAEPLKPPAESKGTSVTAAPARVSTSVSARNGLGADPAPSSARSHRFPSLEDQKLADLAWRRLGLELEPIGDEDLKRARALGYNGGVIVTSASAVYYNGVEPDDILVGLHVWPTTNMKEVAEILNRNDLEQLDPLKFYAIRLKMSPNDNNNFQDAVVSGRISVQKSPPSQRPINPSALPTPTSSSKAPSAFPEALFAVAPQGQGDLFDASSARSSREPTPASPPPIATADPYGPMLPALPGEPPPPIDQSHAPPWYLAIFFSPNSLAPMSYFASELEELKRQYPGLLDGAIVNVEKDAQTAEDYNVKQVPTYILYNSRKEVARLVGQQTTKQLHTELRRFKIHHESTSAPSPTPTVGAHPIQPATPQNDAKTIPPVITGIVSNTDKEPGVLVQLAVKEGTQVKAGQVIGKIDDTEPQKVKLSDGNIASIAVDPNSSASTSGRNGQKLTPAESVFVAYDIPQDLKEKALQYFTRSDVRSMADDRGRYIVQGTQNWHDRFAALLKATPNWRDPAAAKERAAAPVVMKKIGDDDILEWRSVGLSFKRSTDSRNLPPTSARRDQSSVAVAEVVPGSPAAWADIRTGDVPTSVGSFNAGSMPEVRSLLKALGEGLQSKKSVRVVFFRQSDPRYGNISLATDFTLGPEDLGAAPVEPQNSNPPAGMQPRPVAVDKGNISYDGKSFAQWRGLWDQADANPEAKLRALSALEAFAEAGLQREANSAIMYGLYSDSLLVAQRTRQYLNGLSKSDAAPIVNTLLSALKSDLSSDRRVRALRGLAALGPNAESASPELEKSLAKKNPRERIAAATAIKKIVGKDQYQKPVADVLGKELGITVQLTGNGVWAALPRADSVDANAFNKFTEDVIKEQELLFPPDDNKPPKSK